jgi:hypothetical protein
MDEKQSQRPLPPTYRHALESQLADLFDWLGWLEWTSSGEKHDFDVARAGINWLSTALHLLGGYGTTTFDQEWAKTIQRYDTGRMLEICYAGTPMPEGWRR